MITNVEVYIVRKILRGRPPREKTVTISLCQFPGIDFMSLDFKTLLRAAPGKEGCKNIEIEASMRAGNKEPRKMRQQYAPGDGDEDDDY